MLGKGVQWVKYRIFLLHLHYLSILKGGISLNKIGVTAGAEKENLRKHDLHHLTAEQKEIVLEVLSEEKDTFSKTKNDIGHVKDFYLDINLLDDVPVVEAHQRIPRNLYEEVNNHIGNLLVNDWIKQSFSPYSSPMVCV